MQVETRELENQGAVLTFAAPTALDATNGDDLRERFQAASAAYDRVIVDCSAVTFMDSSALGAFVTLHRRLIEKGGVLRLAAVGPSVTMVLQMTRLDRVFAIYQSVAEAEQA